MTFIDTNNTFSDIAVTSRLNQVNSFLKELDSIIDFEKLRPILNKNGVAKSNVAAPAYDNVLMFKVLLLQKYYMMCQPYIILIHKYAKLLFQLVTSFFLQTPQAISYHLQNAFSVGYNKLRYIQKLQR